MSQDKATEPVIERHAVHSQHYIDNASLDPFVNMGVDIPMECEESREDCVKIDMGTERYEIYPATKARVVVKHFYEQSDGSDENRTALMAEPAAKPDIPVASSRNPANESPTDRELKEHASKLLAYERVTTDPDFWEAVQWARQAREHVTFILPRGKELSYNQRKALEALFGCLVADDVTGALQNLAGYTGQKPKPRGWKKLFGRFTVHDRV